MGLCEANKVDGEGGILDKARSALGGRRALVVGLASTGVAASRFLARCGAVVKATDLREEGCISEAEELKALGVSIEGGGHVDESFTGAELVVVSPGVPYKSPFLEKARRSGAAVISEIELAYRFMDCPVIAVAGTNGKSTVTELLGSIFEEAGIPSFVGGNIGTPAIEYVASGGGSEVCVLEVSSFQLETTEDFRPRVGILLNVTEDHLDRYDDFNEYAATKFRLFANQKKTDYAVVNADDPVITAGVARGAVPGRIVFFTTTGTLEEGIYLRGGEVVFAPGNGAVPETYQVSGIRLKGLHNVENVMAAIAASRLSGVPREAVQKALEAFPGLSHRMEFVREIGGVEYIDDSKGTNIGALIMALKGMTAPVVLIAGGRDKGGDYGVLREIVGEKVKRLILIGEASRRMKDSLGGAVDTVMAATLEEAVKEAQSAARPGDTVLLSPACSSFDMFSSYKERGDRFKGLVQTL